MPLEEAVAAALEKAGRSKGDSLAVVRYDRAVLGKPETTTEGFLKADSFLTRAGILEYQTLDGVIRELRPAQAVFDKASLESLKMKPITDDHPVEGGRRVLLTTDNVAQFSKGHVGEVLERVGDNLRAKVLITDATMVKRVLGGLNQLSCGYVCGLKFEGGVFDGKRYDAIQSNIVYNHVAVVPEGRAGPEVAMRIDSAEGLVLAPETIEPEKRHVHVSRLHLLKPRLF